MANASEGGDRAVPARLVASPLPSSFLLRPALEARLDEAFGKRLTVVVAGAGFGKSTLLASWAADVRCAWYAVDAGDAQLPSLARGIVDAIQQAVPELSDEAAALGDAAAGEDEMSGDAFAGHLCERLEQTLRHDLVLVLDDVHELGAKSAGMRLVQSLCRQAPPTVHIVLASRAEPPFSIARLRGRGEVLELDAADLAFTEAEIGAFVVSVLGEGSEHLVAGLHDATGGWPAEVRLAAEALRHAPAEERMAALARLRQPEGPLFSYVAEEVLEREPEDVRELLRRVAWFDRVSPPLCDALGIRDARSTLAALSRRGLLVRAEGDPDGSYSPHALLREFVRERWPLTARDLRALRERAARWFETNGQPVEALHLAIRAGDAAGIGRVLASHGDDLLAAGATEAVLQAAELLPPESGDGRAEQVIGEAFALKGAWREALACFERAGRGSEEISPGLAALMIRVHFDRGEYAEALAVAARARMDGSTPRNEAQVLGLTSQLHTLLGNAEASRAAVDDQFRVATASGDPLALAAAHTGLMVAAAAEDDWSAAERHYREAVREAHASGVPRMIMRIHTDHADLVGGREAVAELEIPLRLAELTGAEVYTAIILNARGEILARLAMFEDAVADLTRSAAILERVGSTRLCWPLTALGDVYRDRGHLARARESYEHALRIAEPANDVQGLIAVYGSLARVLAGQEPEAAADLADRAVELGRSFGIGREWALADAGWVHLALGNRDRAARLAEEAEQAARAQLERPALAACLELRALSAPDPSRESALLEEAREIWRESGSVVGEARTELALALLSPTGSRGPAERAERKLGAAGVSLEAAALAAGPIAALPVRDPPPVEIRTLGGFAVLRAGRPMPVSEWGSKKARDLLQILVARRGRPVPREVLMDALWPGEDPAKLANRLSVAISLLRGALDPEHRFAAEHFVAGDRQAIALHTAHVAVDIEDFFADAEAGLAERAAGDVPAAIELLAAAEARYAGDFLEEVYDDWPVSLRETARSLYVTVTRTLADDAAAAGDDDAAARYLLRILERDEYDERAHLGLVQALARAGRHGEARRAYRTYCARMEKIDVEAAPYPRPNGDG